MTTKELTELPIEDSIEFLYKEDPSLFMESLGPFIYEIMDTYELQNRYNPAY